MLKLARFQQLMIYFSFSSFLLTKWTPGCFFLLQSVLWYQNFGDFFKAKLVEFTVGYANKKFPKVTKVVLKGCWGGEEITIHFCVIWVRNYSLFKLQGIINCRPEAEILVQSFQLVHPISLVLNPSWWVTRFHKDVFLHIRCHVKYHNPTLVVMYLLCRDVSKSVAWRVHSTYIYVYKLCQFVK